jgi:hypothetical protein
MTLLSIIGLRCHCPCQNERNSRAVLRRVTCRV